MIDHWKTQNIKEFIEGLKDYYEDASPNYFPSMGIVEKYTEEEVEEIFKQFDLSNLVGAKGDSVLQTTLRDSSKNKFSFFLLKSLKINLQINKLDEENKSVFIRLAENYLTSKEWFELNLFNFLFNRGYSIKEIDKKFLFDYYKEGKVDSEQKLEKWSYLRFATKLNDATKFQKALMKNREIFTILSFKMKRPVSYNLPNLLGVAINAIQYYRESGEIILKAIKVFDVENKILSLDRKKGTFRRKYQEYLENKPFQDKEFENIAKELFNELK